MLGIIFSTPGNFEDEWVWEPKGEYSSQLKTPFGMPQKGEINNVPNKIVDKTLGKKKSRKICQRIHKLTGIASNCSTFKSYTIGTSLVAQRLRIRLPMQGTWVRALIWDDPTCHGATKPVCHNYWACALEPTSHNYWARMPQLPKPAHLEPILHNKRSHCNEKPTHHNEEQPLLATTRESPRAATKTQHSQINK